MQADNDARSLQWLQSIKSRYASIRGADPSPSKKPGGMNPNVFFDAVSRRDLEYARRILMDEGDVNIRNSSGSTLCHVAVKSGDLDMLKAILQFRPDVNMKENDEVGGSTALHAATLLGELEMVKELLDAGADPRVQDKEGRTPLHVCAMKGYLEIAERLLESSSSPEETLPNEERLEDMRDHQGKTAYYWAKENGYSSIAAILPPMLYDVYGQMEQRKASTKVYDPSKKKAKSTDKKAGLQMVQVHSVFLSW